MLLLYKRKLLLTLNRDGSFTVYIHIINDFHSKMIFNKKKYTRSVWIVTLSSFELLKGGQALKQTTCAYSFRFKCNLELSEPPPKARSCLSIFNFHASKQPDYSRVAYSAQKRLRHTYRWFFYLDSLDLTGVCCVSIIYSLAVFAF